MSKSERVPTSSSVAWWATAATSRRLSHVQFGLSAVNMVSSIIAIYTSHYGVNRILRLSLAVSIISLIYFLIMMLLPVLLVFLMENILAILWFSAFVTLFFNNGSISCPNRYGYSDSCGFSKVIVLRQAIVFTQALVFTLYLATSYASFFTVLSQARERGSSTRSVFEAGIKLLRNTAQYLEENFGENEVLLDIESQEDEKTETEVNERDSLQTESGDVKSIPVNTSE
ncbi:hypothetical protein SKDZ_14G3830 [Saccharomyces kudriavzevii ZP591]|uniref:YNR061C-like protein n=1 Tax=Saccharomyces cerevisiae x Saccharomyces kudriavzevii (strain VIN7) TaxID=1095631 RepID=H0H0L2_SACCK|nr:YNR061C-like protein [Saccharomyces cerevisiae x Saccharomyces kudriavzevii VIN7]CAI4050585.1 hypothetical protein SKDZ_14G3830 [Saccharomyces kudriavzevii ZP591]